jgi:hypothetical protein
MHVAAMPTERSMLRWIWQMAKNSYKMACRTDHVPDHPSLEAHERSIKEIVEERYAQGYSMRGSIPHGEGGVILVFVRKERRD